MSKHASRSTRGTSPGAKPAAAVGTETAPAPPRRRPWLLVIASVLLGTWLVILIVLALVA